MGSFLPHRGYANGHPQGGCFIKFRPRSAKNLDLNHISSEGPPSAGFLLLTSARYRQSPLVVLNAELIDIYGLDQRDHVIGRKPAFPHAQDP